MAMNRMFGLRWSFPIAFSALSVPTLGPIAINESTVRKNNVLPEIAGVAKHALPS